MITIKKNWPLFGSLLVISFHTTAEVDLSINLESLYSDNANRAASSTTSERQDRLSLDIGINHQNSWLTTDINYQLFQLLFDKDTQDERLELNGNANFLFGQQDGRFSVSLNNTRQQILGNPGQVAVSDNFQTRDTTSIAPRWNIFQDQADTFSITGTYSVVNVDQNESTLASFDTTSSGASLSWARKISKVDTVTLSATHLDVEYDDLVGQDYQYQSAFIQYSTELRQLSYSIGVGYNTSDRDSGSRDGSLQWEVNVSYDSGVNRFSFLSESAQTDPSRGNQNALQLGRQELPALGNGITNIVDTFDRTTHSFSWANSSACTRCDITLTGSYSSEDYSEQADQDNSQLSLSLSGDYQLTRASSVNVRYTYQETDFDSANSFSDFDSDTFEMGYSQQINKDLSLRIVARQIERSGDFPASSYDETNVSLSIGYRFL